jgi:sporulation protein YpjB
MKAKLFAIFVCFILFLGFPEHGHAEKNQEVLKDHMEVLVDLSDRVFQYADANQDAAAASLLNELSNKWNASQQVYSERDQRAISTAMIKLKLLINSGDNQREITDAAVSLRLSFDALATEGQPLWKDLHSEVIAPVSKMKTALKNKDNERFQYLLNDFLDEYAVIYPALVIDGQSDTVNLMNKRISTFSDNRLKDVKTNARIRQLNAIEYAINQVFHQSTNTREESMMALVAIISGIVVCVLAYASWRRFTGERMRGERVR